LSAKSCRDRWRAFAAPVRTVPGTSFSGPIDYTRICNVALSAREVEDRHLRPFQKEKAPNIDGGLAALCSWNSAPMKSSESNANIPVATILLRHPRYDVLATLHSLSEQPFDFTMHYTEHRESTYAIAHCSKRQHYTIKQAELPSGGFAM
jgi:hypothetical protein